MTEKMCRLRAVLLFMGVVMISLAAGCSTVKTVVPTAAYPPAQGTPTVQASTAYPSGSTSQPSLPSSALPATPDLSATAPLTVS